MQKSPVAQLYIRKVKGANRIVNTGAPGVKLRCGKSIRQG